MMAARFAIAFALVALASVPAFAQSGATGGTLGKSGKSVSGAANKIVRPPAKENKRQSSLPGIAGQEVCKVVSSRTGWQDFSFADSVSKVVSVRGTWNWFPARYPPSGPAGTAGAHDPFHPAGQFNGGALLVKLSSGELRPLSGPLNLGGAIGSIKMRVNDTDLGLFDNSGEMTVCFR